MCVNVRWKGIPDFGWKLLLPRESKWVPFLYRIGCNKRNVNWLSVLPFHMRAEAFESFCLCTWIIISRKFLEWLDDLFICIPSKFYLFWTQGLPEGVLSNHFRGPSVHVSVHVSVRPSLNISMRLGHHNGTKKWQSPIFEKKSWGVTNGGKPPIWGYFWCFLSISLHPVIKSFWNFIYMISSTLSNI